VEAGIAQFIDQFRLAVLAAGQVVHRLLAGFFRVCKTIDLFRLEEVGV